MGTNLELLAQEAVPQMHQSAIAMQQPVSQAPVAQQLPPQPIPQPTPIALPAPAPATPAPADADAQPATPAATGSDISAQLHDAAVPSSGGAAVETQKTRAAIADEVDQEMKEQLEAQTDAELGQLLAQLQAKAAFESSNHTAAKETLKQVDMERGRARDAYRADQQNSDKQNLWKTKVGQLKEAQSALKSSREESYRASAAVDAVLRQQKIRAGSLAPGTTASTTKRKRMQAPEEGCPYCAHTYTVRDGLSTKTDEEGSRLHLRKCQCREKTPPCRNCPKCRHNNDIMSVNDMQQQLSICQLKFKCEICSCKCPGAGKWIESDDVSRQSYAQRTGLRHDQLQQLGWNGSISVNATFSGVQFMQQHMQQHPEAVHGGGKVGKRMRESRRTLKRLPHDIRGDLERMQVPQEALARNFNANITDTHSPAASGGGSRAAAADNEMLVIKPSADGLTASLSPADPAAAATAAQVRKSPQLAPPPLNENVVRLVDEVFLEAAGVEASAAVRTYLHSQRVRSLRDIKFLIFDELKEALLPMGSTTMLLNKFLLEARELSIK